jgi:hypothetical protein
MFEVHFTPSPRLLHGLDEIDHYLHVHRRTAWRWIQDLYIPAMQSPASTWVTTTSLIDLWIIAASEVQWDLQKGTPHATTEALVTNGSSSLQTIQYS